MAGFFKRRAVKAKNTLSDWMGIGMLLGVLGLLQSIITSIFFPWKKEPGQAETFEEAIARMKLTEADLEERKKMFLTQVFIYLAAGFAVLAYAVWLAFSGYFVEMCLAFLVALLALAYAFRSHFWLFQMKRRKLGCTFKEYLDSSV